MVLGGDPRYIATQSAKQILQKIETMKIGVVLVIKTNGGGVWGLGVMRHFHATYKKRTQ